MQPGVSIAAMALHYRLNADLLRRRLAARETQELDVVNPAGKLLSIRQTKLV
jgi:hypothetical protein